MLHKFANEDVSLGSWFIGLDAEHIDDRRLCCGTPPGKFYKLMELVLTFFLKLPRVSTTFISVNFGKEVDFCQLSGCTLEELNR